MRPTPRNACARGPRAAPRAACALLACAALAHAPGASAQPLDDALALEELERVFDRAFDEAHREAVALGAARPVSGAGDGALLAVLNARATFGRGGAALPAESRVAVERLARRLVRLERVLSVRVIGHADNVGEEADNQLLSERRARYVAGLLSRRWPDVHALAVGAGESTPIADNATEAGRAANRRVEIQVIGIGRPETFEDDGGAPGDAP